MATVAKKVKVETVPDGQDSFQTNRIKIKTEDGETVYIKREKEDDMASVIDTTDCEVMEVKTEKTDDTLLRSALEGPQKPLRRGKQYLELIEKVPTSGRKRMADYDVSTDEEEEEEEMEAKKQCSKTLCQRFNGIIDKLMKKADKKKTKGDDSGNKNIAASKNSAKIKIVFDPSGKLKEWRIDEDKDSGLPPSNLGKILMFANMMKNSETNDSTKTIRHETDEGKSTENLDLIKDIVSQRRVVSTNFQGLKCKICSKEFLNRQVLTTHMKLHHLSLSGLPGSGLFSGENVDKSWSPRLVEKVGAAATTNSTSCTSTRPATSTSTSSASAAVVVHPPENTTIITESVGSEKTLPDVTNHKKSNPEVLFLPTLKTASGQQVVQIPTKTSTNVMRGQASPVSSILSSMIKSDSLPAKSVIKTEPSSTSSVPNASPVTMVRSNDMTNVTPGNVTPQASSAKFSPVTSRMYQCEICPKMYNTADKMAKHVLNHNRERPFMCGLCDYRYLMHNDLEVHLLTHTDLDEETAVLFTCSHCNEEYETDKLLQEHLKIHSDVETETVYECGMCGMELNSQTELQIHMKRHMKNAFEPCRCGICKASFSRVEALKTHIAKEHFPPAEYTCKYCKCRFMNKDALTRHMPVHEQSPAAKSFKIVHPWKCRFCYNRYEYKPDMITHMRIEHPQSRFYNCSFCETSFITKEDLQAHVKTHSVVAHFL